MKKFSTIQKKNCCKPWWSAFTYPKTIVWAMIVFLLSGAVTEVRAQDSYWGLKGTAKGVFGYASLSDILQFPILSIIASVLNWLLSFIGVYFFIRIVHAGFKWMTARGDSQQVTRAKSIIFHSTAGLIVVLSAYAISRYVVVSVTEIVLPPSGT